MSTFGPYPGVVESLHDGDTFRVRITTARHRKPTDIGWDITATCSISVLVDVRLYGCNAAEIATPAGQAALAHLATLMPVGETVMLLSHSWDKYGGRTDASITLPYGDDLATRMIADGFAVAWTGQGPKPVPASAP